jgi:hypothetical protein
VSSASVSGAKGRSREEPLFALHVTERFGRPDFGHLEIQLTIDDPKAYTKPWTVTLRPMQLDPESELLEYVCNENEKDLKHMLGK